jgi:hypothetical protein
MAGTSWPTLAAGRKAKASEVELRFDWIEGDIVPMNAGNQTDAAYDLGTTAYRWRDIWVSRTVRVSNNNGSPLNIQGDGTSAAGEGGIVVVNGAGNAAGSIRLGSNSDVNFDAFVNGVGWKNILAINRTNASLGFATGTAIREFSADTTLADNSDLAVPTEKAVKTYVDAHLGTPIVARLTASTTVASMVPGIKLPFSETVDVLGEFTDSSFKPSVNAVYRVEASIHGGSDTTAANWIEIDIMKNSTTVVGTANLKLEAYGYGTVYAVAILSLTTSDSISVYGIGQNSIVYAAAEGSSYLYITKM